MITIDQAIRQTPPARDGADRRDGRDGGPTFDDALHEASEPERREDRTRSDARDRPTERTPDPERRPDDPRRPQTDGGEAPHRVDPSIAEVGAEPTAPTSDGSAIASIAPLSNSHLAIAATTSTTADATVSTDVVVTAATNDAGSAAIDPNGSASTDMLAATSTTAARDVAHATGTTLDPAGTGEDASSNRVEASVLATAPAAPGSNAPTETGRDIKIDPDVQIDVDGEATTDVDGEAPTDVDAPVADAARPGSGGDRSNGDPGGTPTGADGSTEPSVDSMESAAPDEPGPTSTSRSTARDPILGGSPAARELLERLDLRRASIDGSLEVEIRTERFGIVRVEAADSGDGVSLSLRGDGSNGDELHDLARELRHEFERDGRSLADVDVDDRSAGDHDSSDIEESNNEAGAGSGPDSDTVGTALSPGGVDLHL